MGKYSLSDNSPVNLGSSGGRGGNCVGDSHLSASNDFLMFGCAGESKFQVFKDKTYFNDNPKDEPYFLKIRLILGITLRISPIF